MNVYYLIIRGRRLPQDYATLTGALAGVRAYKRDNRVNGRAPKRLGVRLGPREETDDPFIL